MTNRQKQTKATIAAYKRTFDDWLATQDGSSKYLDGKLMIAVGIIFFL